MRRFDQKIVEKLFKIENKLCKTILTKLLQRFASKTLENDSKWAEIFNIFTFLCNLCVTLCELFWSQNIRKRSTTNELISPFFKRTYFQISLKEMDLSWPQKVDNGKNFADF